MTKGGRKSSNPKRRGARGSVEAFFDREAVRERDADEAPGDSDADGEDTELLDQYSQSGIDDEPVSSTQGSTSVHRCVFLVFLFFVVACFFRLLPPMFFCSFSCCRCYVLCFPLVLFC